MPAGNSALELSARNQHASLPAGGADMGIPPPEGLPIGRGIDEPPPTATGWHGELDEPRFEFWARREAP